MSAQIRLTLTTQPSAVVVASALTSVTGFAPSDLSVASNGTNFQVHFKGARAATAARRLVAMFQDPQSKLFASVALRSLLSGAQLEVLSIEDAEGVQPPLGPRDGFDGSPRLSKTIEPHHEGKARPPLPVRSASISGHAPFTSIRPSLSPPGPVKRPTRLVMVKVPYFTALPKSLKFRQESTAPVVVSGTKPADSPDSLTRFQESGRITSQQKESDEDFRGVSGIIIDSTIERALMMADGPDGRSMVQDVNMSNDRHLSPPTSPLQTLVIAASPVLRDSVPQRINDRTRSGSKPVSLSLSVLKTIEDEQPSSFSFLEVKPKPSRTFEPVQVVQSLGDDPSATQVRLRPSSVDPPHYPAVSPSRRKPSKFAGPPELPFAAHLFDATHADSPMSPRIYSKEDEELFPAVQIGEHAGLAVANRKGPAKRSSTRSTDSGKGPYLGLVAPSKSTFSVSFDPSTVNPASSKTPDPSLSSRLIQVDPPRTMQSISSFSSSGSSRRGSRSISGGSGVSGPSASVSSASVSLAPSFKSGSSKSSNFLSALFGKNEDTVKTDWSWLWGVDSEDEE